jgi:hypothetical protein
MQRTTIISLFHLKKMIPFAAVPGGGETFVAKRRRLSFACLMLLLFSACPGISHAQTQPRSDATTLQRPQEIAQFIAGISSYVRWPAVYPELQMCVVGDTKYASALLDGSASALVPRMRAKRIGAKSDVVSLECNLVYIGSLSNAERDKLLARLNGQPILSISEPEISCTVGSMFCLKFRDGQISFDVNLDAIARSGLRVHPSVLQLARHRASSPP